MTEFDVNNFDALRISLASAEDVRSWSRGEVKKPETINYRTLKPEKDGLYCEKIFGPTKDWECACGKYKRVRFKGIVCERCGVEVTRSKVRRERMGHIELAAPVSHIWYFKGSRPVWATSWTFRRRNWRRCCTSPAPSSPRWTRSPRGGCGRPARRAGRRPGGAGRRARPPHRGHPQAVHRLRAEDDDFVDDLDDDERLTPEEVEEEIADIYEEFNERKALRQDAFDAFLKIEPKQLIADEALYREMRACYRDYFTGGMGADRCATCSTPWIWRPPPRSCARSSPRARAEARQGREAPEGGGRVPEVGQQALRHDPGRDPGHPARPAPHGAAGRRPLRHLRLNDLYRRVINRNNRLKRLLDLGAPEIIINNEKRMLQEAVDSLFDNGRRGRPVTGPGNRPLKSISDMLKGKQGRFRQNLLGKRVDYSAVRLSSWARAQAAPVRPAQQMALELFKPFVMKRLVELEYACQYQGRQTRRGPRCQLRVGCAGRGHRRPSVLLNRAPTLHRLGIQAFEPVLVEGKAIKLHPLVCTAFNADFDGDQMAVHVPLGAEAQAEARVLMLSSNNIKSPAHGHPLTVPTQDMIIGLYYLTAVRDGFPGEGRVFIDLDDALNAYDARADLDLQAKISVRLPYNMKVATAFNTFEDHKEGERIETSVGRIIFNDVLPPDYPFLNYEMNKKEISRLVEDVTNTYDLSEVPPILDGLKDAGFHYATRAGVTVSVYDATIPPTKPEILAQADARVAAIDEDYEMGLMSNEERHKQVVDIWNDANEEVGEAMAENFDKFNPIYMMAFSGARGNINRFASWPACAVLCPTRRARSSTVPLRRTSARVLSVLEYFISTHGARKGLADTALRTADSGYLTRRLVDVAQDVIIREIDCGTTEGVSYPVRNEKNEVDENLVGRCLLEPVANPETGEIIAEAGSYLHSMAQLREIDAAGVEEVVIRTIMTCHADHGVCQKCYGWDLATARPVNIGTAVGIIAAQSIGEPGTQLTMRTFHTGGVAGEDITHGLPRVQELFEARKPKGQAVLAEISGTMQVSGDKMSKTITIHDQEGNYREYVVSARAQLLPGVYDGCEVTVGQQLTKGSVNPHDLLRLTDPNTTLRYIVGQVQGVYVSQGVDINDKHIEVIARQMLRKVAVLDAGDSDFLPGRQVNRFEFEKVANELIAEGKEPPVGQPLLLGITKASLATDSWMSAASFQETTKVLTDAAIEGKTDTWPA